MPAIPDLAGTELESLLRFLEVGSVIPTVTPSTETEEGQYIFTGYRKFLDPEGYPAFNPPWGTLSAICQGQDKPLPTCAKINQLSQARRWLALVILPFFAASKASVI